ncbi:MAG: glycosyltransferase [Flavobacteriales bacterium]|nr:glycosyltransferase [Flavobacteriales bacterium]
MRIALVHDWLAVQGGAERVTRELIDLFDPDVFALVDFLSPEARQEVLGGRHARTTFIQHLPFARTHFRSYLPLFPMAIERLDLRGYDLVLSASYAVAKGVRTQPGQVHLSYIHTPMRYAWVMEDEYVRDHGMHGLKGFVLRRVLQRLRRWDRDHTSRITCLLANSHNTADRIRTCYGRESRVVHPPVDVDRFTPGPGPRGHYLAVSRLVPYKRVDRIIDAFSGLPRSPAGHLRGWSGAGTVDAIASTQRAVRRRSAAHGARAADAGSARVDRRRPRGLRAYAAGGQRLRHSRARARRRGLPGDGGGRRYGPLLPRCGSRADP